MRTAFSFLNIPDGWLAEAVSGQNLQLTVRGLQDNLNHVDAGTITPHADLSALIDENGTVTAGEQEVTVKFFASRFCGSGQCGYSAGASDSACCFEYRCTGSSVKAGQEKM